MVPLQKSVSLYVEAYSYAFSTWKGDAADRDECLTVQREEVTCMSVFRIDYNLLVTLVYRKTVFLKSCS